MRILIVSAVPPDSTRGNRITAVRWQKLIRQLGHEVDLQLSYRSGESFDCLIALHARHSEPSISSFRESNPDSPIIVCLTGTDLHCDFDPHAADSGNSQAKTGYQAVLRSLETATRIVLLEPEGQKKLPARLHKKCHVIFQSAELLADRPSLPNDCFLITVIGHLRPVKDPLRTALAARLLPKTSRIKVLHIGKALRDEMRKLAEQESEGNARYKWIGPVPHQEAVKFLVGSQITVLSSLHEGAPSVISEAVVNRVPVLATRIDASIGLLGADYPGLFDVGDTNQLALLMNRAETEPDFLDQLRTAIAGLDCRFSPKTELNEWQNLLNSVLFNRSASISPK